MVFCFVQNFFFGQHESQNIFFFFQNSALGYMTKTLNPIIFFFLHQNQNIFFSNIGNQNIFLEKNHTPPPFQVKWSFPYLFSHTTRVVISYPLIPMVGIIHLLLVVPMALTHGYYSITSLKYTETYYYMHNAYVTGTLPYLTLQEPQQVHNHLCYNCVS